MMETNPSDAVTNPPNLYHLRVEFLRETNLATSEIQSVMNSHFSFLLCECSREFQCPNTQTTP